MCRPLVLSVAGFVVGVGLPGALESQTRPDPGDFRPRALIGLYLGVNSDFPLWGAYGSKAVLEGVHGFGTISRSTQRSDGAWEIQGGVGVRDVRIGGLNVIMEAGVQMAWYADRPEQRNRVQATTGVGWEGDLSNFRTSVMYRAGWAGERTDEFTFGLRIVLGWH